MQTLIQSVLALFGMLVPKELRTDWKREWHAEIWYRWFRGSTRSRGVQRAWKFCLELPGCFQDAFHLNRLERKSAAVLRQEKFLWLCWPLLAIGLIVGQMASGYRPTTLSFATNLVREDNRGLTLVSLKGQLGSGFVGVPSTIARDWKERSRLLAKMASIRRVRSDILINRNRRLSVTTVRASENLFDVLGGRGVEIEAGGSYRRAEPGVEPVVFLSRTCLEKLERESGTRPLFVTFGDGRRVRIAGVLQQRFWFFSPDVDVYELRAEADFERAFLLVRTKTDTTATGLQKDLAAAASAGGNIFIQTQPKAVPLLDGLFRPITFFLLGSLLAYVMATIRSRGFGTFPNRFHIGPLALNFWIWQSVKYVLVLLAVFTIGLEIFVGRDQSLVEPLGGPQLLWFYILACSMAFSTLGTGKHFRCRVCCRILERPVAIGSVGPLFLDWCGTELMCSHDHGMLCVPYYRASWQEEAYWVQA